MLVRNRPYCHGCGLEHCSSGSQCCSRCSTRLLHDEEPLRRTWSLATLFDGTSSALHDICEWVARGTSVPFHHKFSVELNDDCDDFLRELQKVKVYAHVRSNSRHSDFLELSLAAFLEVVLLIITPPCERFSSLSYTNKGTQMGLGDAKTKMIMLKLVRLVKSRKAQFIVGENVLQFFSGPNSEAWQWLQEAARQTGYTVIYKRIDTRELQLPLSSPRGFFGFVRDDVAWASEEFEVQFQVAINHECRTELELKMVKLQENEHADFRVSPALVAASKYDSLSPREKLVVDACRAKLSGGGWDGWWVCNISASDKDGFVALNGKEGVCPRPTTVNLMKLFCLHKDMNRCFYPQEVGIILGFEKVPLRCMCRGLHVETAAGLKKLCIMLGRAASPCQMRCFVGAIVNTAPAAFSAAAVDEDVVSSVKHAAEGDAPESVDLSASWEDDPVDSSPSADEDVFANVEHGAGAFEKLWPASCEQKAMICSHKVKPSGKKPMLRETPSTETPSTAAVPLLTPLRGSTVPLGATDSPALYRQGGKAYCWSVDKYYVVVVKRIQPNCCLVRYSEGSTETVTKERLKKYMPLVLPAHFTDLDSCLPTPPSDDDPLPRCLQGHQLTYGLAKYARGKGTCNGCEKPVAVDDNIAFCVQMVDGMETDEETDCNYYLCEKCLSGEECVPPSGDVAVSPSDGVEESSGEHWATNMRNVTRSTRAFVESSCTRATDAWLSHLESSLTVEAMTNLRPTSPGGGHERFLVTSCDGLEDSFPGWFQRGDVFHIPCDAGDWIYMGSGKSGIGVAKHIYPAGLDALCEAVHKSRASIPWAQHWHKDQQSQNWLPGGRMSCWLNGSSTHKLSDPWAKSVQALVDVVLKCDELLAAMGGAELTPQLQLYREGVMSYFTWKDNEWIRLHQDGDEVDHDHPIVHIYVAGEALVKLSADKAGVKEWCNFKARPGSVTIFAPGADQQMWHQRETVGMDAGDVGFTVVLRHYKDGAIDGKYKQEATCFQYKRAGMDCTNVPMPNIRQSKRIEQSVDWAHPGASRVLHQRYISGVVREDISITACILANEEFGNKVVLRQQQPGVQFTPGDIFAKASVMVMVGMEPQAQGGAVKGKEAAGGVVSALLTPHPMYVGARDWCGASIGSKMVFSLNAHNLNAHNWCDQSKLNKKTIRIIAILPEWGTFTNVSVYLGDAIVVSEFDGGVAAPCAAWWWTLSFPVTSACQLELVELWWAEYNQVCDTAPKCPSCQHFLKPQLGKKKKHKSLHPSHKQHA